MTAVSAGQGLVPVFHPSGLPRPQKFNDAIDTAVTQSIYKGTPVQLTTAGLIVPITDLDWDATADDFIGVFNGIEYTDSNGQRKVSNHWFGPTTLFSPADMWVYVWVDPDIIYQAQASGAVAQTALGAQFNLASNGGSTVTGLSSGQLLAAPVAGGSQGYFRCVNLDPRVDNAWGDAFTILQVQIASHEYVANKVGI